MEDTDGVFHCSLRSHSLDGLDDNSLCLLVGSHLGVVNNFVDILLCLCLGFVLERLYERVSCFLCREARDGFEFASLLVDERVKTFLLFVELVFLVVNFLLFLLEVFVVLVDCEFALLEFVLEGLHLLVALVGFLVEFSFAVEEFFLHLQLLFLFDDFGFDFCLLDDLIVLLLHNISEEYKADDTSEEKAAYGHDYCCYIHFLKMMMFVVRLLLMIKILIHLELSMCLPWMGIYLRIRNDGTSPVSDVGCREQAEEVLKLCRQVYYADAAE